MSERMSGPLSGRVCLVTGASRGIGRGIALQLGEAGATVYITGRTLSPSDDAKVGGSLTETAQEVESRGGKCIPVQCDHSNDEDVKKLFEQIKTEQNGRLDALVNNAYAGANALAKAIADETKFWEDESLWDIMNNVGLRGHYMAAVHASRLMIPAKQGLIINISSMAGLIHVASAPLGIGKNACDRMAAECAIDLKEHNIAYVCLWPMNVSTEINTNFQKENLSQATENDSINLLRILADISETPEYVGKAVVHMALDPKIMNKSRKIILTAWAAKEYGFNDIDGRRHMNPFSLKFLLKLSGHTGLAAIMPECLSVPKWLMAAQNHHFS